MSAAQGRGVHPGRFTAQTDDDVVVFLIGMRINQLRKVHKWLPVARAMGPMIRELMAHPERGLLHAQQYVWGRTILVVQYWKSFEQLEHFARNPDDLHLPAWRAFNQRVGTDGTVGIFHETYVVPAGNIESIYGNMPTIGLAAATSHVPVAARGQAAAYRMRRAAVDTPAEPVPG